MCLKRINCYNRPIGFTLFIQVQQECPSFSFFVFVEASVIKQEVILDEDEEISFTVVDELREDSQGSQENSQKGSKVTDDARVTVNHSRSNSNDDRKRDTFGLVEYSDDHTSIVKVNDTEATVSENLPAQCFGTSERTCKRKPEGGSEQQVRDNDVNSLRDITSISKVGQSILKRLKLGSSLNKPEQAHEVGSLEKSSGEPREELIVASEGKYRITKICPKCPTCCAAKS